MNRYKVKLVKSKRSETVHADYFRIENGVLTFRCVNCKPGQGYPLFVKCFAAGAWTMVTNETPAFQDGETVSY